MTGWLTDWLAGWLLNLPEWNMPSPLSNDFLLLFRLATISFHFVIVVHLSSWDNIHPHIDYDLTLNSSVHFSWIFSLSLFISRWLVELYYRSHNRCFDFKCNQSQCFSILKWWGPPKICNGNWYGKGIDRGKREKDRERVPKKRNFSKDDDSNRLFSILFHFIFLHISFRSSPV